MSASIIFDISDKGYHRTQAYRGEYPHDYKTMLYEYKKCITNNHTNSTFNIDFRFESNITIFKKDVVAYAKDNGFTCLGERGTKLLFESIN